MQSISRRLVAEGFGTALLLAAIVGSGIMAERLAGGNVGIALLCNSLATGAILYVLITVFAPVSGAQFNPAVTLVVWIRGEIAGALAFAYTASQLIGAVVGTFIAHAMFGLSFVELSTTERAGTNLWLAEAVATFGLIFAILGTLRWKPDAVATAVGLYILSAYWFTASTSFANPAVTIARSLTNSFSGIAPSGLLAFVLAQLFGAVLAALVCNWLFASQMTERKSSSL